MFPKLSFQVVYDTHSIESEEHAKAMSKIYGTKVGGWGAPGEHFFWMPEPVGWHSGGSTLEDRSSCSSLWGTLGPAPPSGGEKNSRGTSTRQNWWKDAKTGKPFSLEVMSNFTIDVAGHVV